jgi:hypothetical protein
MQIRSSMQNLAIGLSALARAFFPTIREGVYCQAAADVRLIGSAVLYYTLLRSLRQPEGRV